MTSNPLQPFRPFVRRLLAVALCTFAALRAEPAKQNFNVSADLAERSLKSLSAQSGLEIVFSTEIAGQVRTNAVQGEFSALEVAHRMLAGTDLAATQNVGGTIVVSRRTSAPPEKNGQRAAQPVASDGPNPSPTTKPAQPDAGAANEAVALSPFVVSSAKDTGYQAANTLAGSRMSTPLRDTAASLSVLTSELLSDIGATNLNQAIAFGNNTELDDTNASNGNGSFEFFTTFRIRGQAATVGRNYFRWKLPTDLFNVERIEEARGPNSILFGIASAGGLISLQTKQATTNRNAYQAELRYGSYDSRRASVDLNQASFNGKLGVRLNAVSSRLKGYREYTATNDDRVHVAGKYNVAPNTVLRAEYEAGKTDNNAAEGIEMGDNLMLWYNAGKPLVGLTGLATGVARNNTAAQLAVSLIDDGRGNLTTYDARSQGISLAAVASGQVTDPTLVDNLNYRINPSGPSGTQASQFRTYAAFLDQKFWKNTYLQLAFNHQDYTYDSWYPQFTSATQAGLRGDPNQFLANGAPNPNAGRPYIEAYWIDFKRKEHYNNGRISLSQELDLGNWGFYRLAGLAEREQSRWMKDSRAEYWFEKGTGRAAFPATVAPAVGAQPSGAVNRVLRRHYITPGDYGSYYSSIRPNFITGLVDPTNPARTLYSGMSKMGTSDFDDPAQQDSYLFAGQAYYFKRKLVLAGGLRRDTSYTHEGSRAGIRDPVTQEVVVDFDTIPRTNRTINATTKTYGAVYHALPWVSLRYNKSDSFELPQTGVQLIPRPTAEGYFIGNRVGDNPRGKGQDYGIELNLLDDKISVRATRFETTRAGAQQFQVPNNPTPMSDRILAALVSTGAITQTEASRHDTNAAGTETDSVSTGYEFSVVANVTKNWRVSANYSITDSVTSNFSPEITVWASYEIPYFQKFNQSLLTSTGQTIAQEIAAWQLSDVTAHSTDGLATQGNRRDKASAVTRYSFSSGPLKGLSLGGSVSHQGKMVLAATTAGQVIYGNSFTRVGAFAVYKFGRVPHLQFLKNLSLQLNVDNVLNQRDPLLRRLVNANVTPLVYSRVQPQDPRSWQLTANLGF